jgi:DNA-binding XRE family transcriptional regulator
MNYTDKQTAFMCEQYKDNPTIETVEMLAEKLSKSTKSIIGKLSREGVYQRAVYKNKVGELPLTKVEIVSTIADNLGIEVENLVGLEKSPKEALKNLEIATGVTRT